jgi:hypothetical protein
MRCASSADVRNTPAILANDSLAPLKTSPAMESVRRRIREVSPPIQGEHPFYRDIAALEKLH